MRFLLRSVSFLSNNVVKVNNLQLRNFAKVLSKERHTVILNQETLTGRLLLYLNNDKEQCTNLQIPASKLRQDLNQLCKLSSKEILEITTSLTNLIMSREEAQLILNELDIELVLRFGELSTTEILTVLNVYMALASNVITEYKFYQKAMKYLNDSLLSLNKKELLQFIFYLGLKKKCLESQTMLRHCLRNLDDEFINSLTSEELCIVCNSAFKTSTKIINKTLLRKVETYIDDHLFVLGDSPLFVTLVKTLRHNRCQNDNLLNTISCGVIFNKTYPNYSFSMMCHVMALYADHFYYDSNLFNIFVNECLEQLKNCDFVSKNVYHTKQPRGKDIKRFLWVLSMFSDLKLVSRDNLKNLIIPKIIERIVGREFENDLTSLIDITLYLWMLNCRPYELVPYVFKKQYAQSLCKFDPQFFRNTKLYFLAKNSKTNLRLTLLLYAILIEDPELAKKLPVKAPLKRDHDYSNVFQLRKRGQLQRVLNNLDRIKRDLNISKFELSYEVPHTNIVGITGFRSGGTKAVFIEVLDDYTRIRNVDSDVPVGLMSLKLRLLDHSEEGVLVVNFENQ